jgi:predicted nuclease with TOPRIM domain
VIEDLNVAVQRLKGEAARREEVFRKSVEEQKTHHEVLAKKFDELFKQAKEKPDTKRPFKDIDLD